MSVVDDLESVAGYGDVTACQVILGGMGKYSPTVEEPSYQHFLC
jgi:hypothetical protein